MARTIRIVNYAVNGSGLGHLMRLVALSRWLRRYAAHAGVKAEIYFLTSSEADSLLFGERFASFKLPSKTIVGETGIDKQAYLALAKQWVWHSLGLLQPDLLVVDTFPRGSFGELLSALDLCRRRAFIYRPSRESFAARADFQAMLPLYDAILVPDHDDASVVQVPAEAARRVRHAGPVMARERIELLDRGEARARLGIAGERLAVYVSAGGVGDPGAEQQLAAVDAALAHADDVHLVIAAGPLYRGRPLRGERITWLSEPGTAELMPGLDLAICAAGYNTFFELMHAGVPAIFLPQDKVADEQERRAARAVRAGAALLLHERTSAALVAAVDGFRDPVARAAAAHAARALVPTNHARELAAELLRLVLPAAEVAAAEDAVDDELLLAARDLGLELEPFFELGRALVPEGGVAGTEATRAAVRLHRFAHARGIPAAAALRVVHAFLRKLVGGGVEERAAAAEALLAELAAFDDWAGAATLLKVFGVERQLLPAAFAGELGAFLGRLRGRGEDLYRGIAYLAHAQGAGAELPSNQELLRAAAARCAS